MLDCRPVVPAILKFLRVCVSLGYALVVLAGYLCLSGSVKQAVNRINLCFVGSVFCRLMLVFLYLWCFFSLLVLSFLLILPEVDEYFDSDFSR